MPRIASKGLLNLSSTFHLRSALHSTRLKGDQRGSSSGRGTLDTGDRAIDYIDLVSPRNVASAVTRQLRFRRTILATSY